MAHMAQVTGRLGHIPSMFAHTKQPCACLMQSILARRSMVPSAVAIICNADHDPACSAGHRWKH